MGVARPHTGWALAGAVALAGLTGCAMDDEAAARARVDAWVDGRIGNPG